MSRLARITVNFNATIPLELDDRKRGEFGRSALWLVMPTWSIRAGLFTRLKHQPQGVLHEARRIREGHALAFPCSRCGGWMPVLPLFVTTSGDRAAKGLP